MQRIRVLVKRYNQGMSHHFRSVDNYSSRCSEILKLERKGIAFCSCSSAPAPIRKPSREEEATAAFPRKSRLHGTTRFFTQVDLLLALKLQQGVSEGSIVEFASSICKVEFERSSPGQL